VLGDEGSDAIEAGIVAGALHDADRLRDRACRIADGDPGPCGAVVERDDPHG
jgi:hypothetical protein